MTKDALISYLKGCALLGKSSDGVAYVRAELLEEAIVRLSGERQPNFTDPNWLDVPHSKQTDFTRYITVTANRVEGYDGVRVTCRENIPKGASIGFHVPRGTEMLPHDRADYLKAVLRNTIASLDDLFKDCDTPECPNCAGKVVKL